MLLYYSPAKQNVNSKDYDMKKIFGYEIRKAGKKEINSIPMTSSGTGVFLQSTAYPMLLSTVYRCVDVISDAVATLPCETYKIDKDGFKSPYKEHPVYDLMNEEPNEFMTRFTFFKTMVQSILLKGNGFAYVERDARLKAVQLIYIPAPNVTITWITDMNGIPRMRYRVTGFRELVEPRDMVHVLNFSYDGVIGVSTLTHAAQTIGIATDSEAYAKGFFRGGGAAAGILSFEGRLTKPQREQAYAEWEARTNPETGKPNGIVIIEGGVTKYAPITINPRDAQMIESRKFNVEDICRFFSVSPVKAFDLSAAHYSTVEATQLAFLTDTVAPMITKIELELQRKIFLPAERKTIKIEFNTNEFLRADKAAQATYYRQMFNIGSMTQNEIRKGNNLPRVEGGDETFIPSNMQTVSAMKAAPAKEKVNNKAK